MTSLVAFPKRLAYSRFDSCVDPRATERIALSLSPRQTSAYTLADHGPLEVAAKRQLV